MKLTIYNIYLDIIIYGMFPDEIKAKQVFPF